MHCITFAFSQYFMHFRCVFYMLKSYVLVGLDWAELMMLILLHVTCSCIFYAYIPFFSYFDIDVVQYSSTSLSLSLSLSLSRIVSQIVSGASSSSDSSPLHVRFCDNKARQDFSENFSRRGIHSKC